MNTTQVESSSTPSCSKQQPRQRLFEEAVKPGLGNLEPELVIQRLRRGGDQSFRLAEQADQPALVKRPLDFALHPRPIDFQHRLTSVSSATSPSSPHRTRAT